uniref:hypothetical protein n=1 Tax=Klebsiella pneumoniae TaxID=573 RepID=UPI0025A054F8
EDEAARAAALAQLTGAGIPLLLAMDLLGFELTDKQRLELAQAAEEKKERAEKLTAQLAGGPKDDDEGDEDDDEKEDDPEAQ